MLVNMKFAGEVRDIELWEHGQLIERIRERKL